MQMVTQTEQDYIADPTEEKHLALQEAQKIYKTLSLSKEKNS